MTSARRLTAAGAAVLLAAALMTAAHVTTATATGSSIAPRANTAHAAAPARPAVIGKRIIGKSVNGHPIRAWHLGDTDSAKTAILLGRHHGNEPAGDVILKALRDGPPVHGVNLWVVPRLNPDGALRNTRQNARGVDLNRNFPFRWKPMSGYYYSGPRPASEPETRAAMRFMDKVDPDYVVTMHQPFYGLDVRHAKNRAFARRLSRELNLPDEHLPCQGGCHGTLSGWFNHRHKGASVTVEFGESPSRHYLTVRAPRGLVRAVGGTVGRS